MDLLGTGIKAACREIMEDHADTFSRQITVISEPSRIFNDTGGNPLFPYPRDREDVPFTPVETVISARILYGRPRDSNLSQRTEYSDVGIDIPEGWVRVKIRDDDYETMKAGKRVVVDGLDFIIDSHSRGHGLFEVDFYTFYLRPVSSD